VRVSNGGEVPETGVDVRKETTVEIGGFLPGELDETARVTVKVGPVEYEKSTSNNTLTGTVKFGM
jgi:hypothetical protein